MVVNPFTPQKLVGRQAELQQVSQILATDGDLLLAGVPGSGRRTLLRHAARAVGARVIEIDCLRATDSNRFLHLLTEGIIAVFQSSAELALIQQWSQEQPIILDITPSGQARLVWHPTPNNEWVLFQSLLALPQAIAERLDCRVVLVFLNFSHIRSWDRSEKWQSYLRQEIQQQTQVSYALIATVAESWVLDSNVKVILLGPLDDVELSPWIISALAAEGLQFEPEGQALELFLASVQGHVGDAIALARRIWLDYRAFEAFSSSTDHDSPEAATIRRNRFQSEYHAQSQPLKVHLVYPHHVYRSTLALVEDLSLTFESLILLLPPSQVRVLESLALDPTDSPHSREYIQKHQLSRGGGLQGALASLEQKGLVYGADYGYRMTMPLLAFWLKYHLA
ncbi:MAG: ATP-binding protein [Verrucomicrobia bacterium]|nr:ATP-binding protein [Leptolyngbya sp. ES-bin-22]